MSPVADHHKESSLVPMGARDGNRWRVSARLADMTRVPREVRRGQIKAHGKDIVVDWNKSALIVIDMQNDFCHPHGWLAGIGVDIAPARTPIAPLLRLLPALRGAGVPIVWVNWGNRPDLANLSPALLHVYDGAANGRGLGSPLPHAPVPGARVLEKDSWAAAVVDELAPEQGELRVEKYRMSGFWDTPLDSILRQQGVTTLFFSGVNADQCVLATLMDANFLGYDTILVEDCSATTSPGFCWEATLYNVRQCFGFSATSSALREGLSAP